jgi:hypothetical protein
LLYFSLQRPAGAQNYIPYPKGYFYTQTLSNTGAQQDAKA